MNFATFMESRTGHSPSSCAKVTNEYSCTSTPTSALTVRKRTGHERPEGECSYGSTFSLTSAPDRDGWSTPRPLPPLYPRKQTPYPLYRSLSGPQGQSRRRRKSSPHRDSISGPSSPWRVAIPTVLSRRAKGQFAFIKSKSLEGRYLNNRKRVTRE